MDNGTNIQPHDSIEKRGKPIPSPFIVPKHPGLKSPLERFLEKNPVLAKEYEEMMKKVQGPDYQPITASEISTIDHLHESASFELTRSQQQGVYRGKTFVDYNKVMAEILALKLAADNQIKIANAYVEAIKSNKDEADTFYRAICAVIVKRITDEKERKEFIDSIKRVYNEYYAQQQTVVEQIKLEYPLVAKELKLSPPATDGESKE